MWSIGSPKSDDEEEHDGLGSSRGSRDSRTMKDSRSSSSCSLDSLALPWRTESETVHTKYGAVNVNIWGSPDKPALVTYHDIGLNHMTCFQGLFMCSDMSTLLFSNFCIYHIDAPGHEFDAEESSNSKELSADDLMEQVAQVLMHYRLKQTLCFGVTAGAYILTLLSIRHPSLVRGLILISPVCKSASWVEWASTKVLINTLYFCGFTRSVKESLLERYFCKELSGFQNPASDAIRAFRKELEERVPEHVGRYIQAMLGRKDLSNDLSKVMCPALLLVGHYSPFKEDSEHMMAAMNPGLASMVEVEACGSLITEERPHMLQAPLENFMHCLGYNLSLCPATVECWSPLHSPTSTLFSIEEFAPKACGLNLKPIRTRSIG